MQTFPTRLRAMQGAPFPQRPRAKYSRTTNGCLSCRRRRKRCDENQPRCIACQRNKLLCIWSGTGDSTGGRLARDVPRTSPGRPAPTDSPPNATLAVNALPRAISFPGVNQTLQMTQWSPMLYDHWLDKTSNLMSTLQLQNSALHTYLTQTAPSDNLLSHTILVVSGTHLNFNQTAAPEIKQAIFAHYKASLEGIKQEIDRVLYQSDGSCLRLCLILLLVCHAEAISGSTKGEIFPHLTAVRHLIMIYQKSAQAATRADEVLLGLVLEIYAYLALISNITPYGIMSSRTVPLDHFVAKLNPLSQYTSYGTFFSCGHDVFEYIPRIAILARQCLDEVRTSGSCSPSSMQTYGRILSELESLGTCRVIAGTAKSEAAAAREVYRRSLLIFLETAIAGPMVANIQSRRIIQQQVDILFPLSLNVRETNFGSIMMWPLMIVASCLTREDQREVVRRQLKRQYRWLTNQIPAAQEIVELLWASDDPRAFGPYGLYLIMQQHELNYSMA